MTVTAVWKSESIGFIKLVNIFLLLSAIVTPVVVTLDLPARAAARASDPVTFAVIGDYGVDSSNEASMATMVDSWAPEFIITTGDNRVGPRTYDQVVGQYFCEYLKDVLPGVYCSAGNAPINSFFPSLGNHDYTDGAFLAEYLDYFALPGSGINSSNTSGSERYYDFISGPVHFFAIDSHDAILDEDDRVK